MADTKKSMPALPVRHIGRSGKQRLKNFPLDFYG